MVTSCSTAGEKAPAFALARPVGDEGEARGFQGPQGARVLLPQGGHPGLHHPGLRPARHPRRIGDTAVLGISPDPPAKQAKFDQKYGLGFPLLADEDHAVAEAYGVWAEKSMYGRKYMGIVRSAFLIDEKGKLAEVWYKISPEGHAEEPAGRRRAGVGAA